jgi:hypothetical protein
VTGSERGATARAGTHQLRHLPGLGRRVPVSIDLRREGAGGIPGVTPWGRPNASRGVPSVVPTPFSQLVVVTARLFILRNHGRGLGSPSGPSHERRSALRLRFRADAARHLVRPSDAFQSRSGQCAPFWRVASAIPRVRGANIQQLFGSGRCVKHLPNRRGLDVGRADAMTGRCPDLV